MRETRQFTEMAMTLLESLGFIINRDKSILNPTREITFLWFTINSVKMTLFLPPRQRNQHSPTMSPNAGPAKSYSPSYSSDLGYSRICSSSDMEGPSPLSHASSAANTGITTKPQQLCKRGGPFGSIQARTALVGSEHHIMQWQSYSDSFPRFHHLHRRIETRLGGGGVCSNQQANGKWSATEKHLHINILELKGAFLALQALIKDKRSITVSLNIDNSTAVAYINHQGGTHSPQLLHLALQLWNWCVERHIVLVAHHVPGKSNSLADR